jgi:hypothetical protein
MRGASLDKLGMTKACYGDEGTRTPDFLLAKQALYQLSYIPVLCRSLTRIGTDALP